MRNKDRIFTKFTHPDDQEYYHIANIQTVGEFFLRKGSSFEQDEMLMGVVKSLREQGFTEEQILPALKGAERQRRAQARLAKTAEGSPGK